MLGYGCVSGDAEGPKAVDDSFGFVLAASEGDAACCVLVGALEGLTVAGTFTYAVLAGGHVVGVGEVDEGGCL